jgi:Domain of unknown function (DUF4386)
MLNITKASNFRRTLAGLALIAAPVLLTITDATFPSGDPGPDPAAQLALMAQHRDALLLSGMFFLLMTIPYIPAVFGLMHLVRERGVVLVHLGGALTVIGVLATAAAGGIRLVPVEMAASGVDRAATAALLAYLFQSPVFMPIFLLTWGFNLGIIVLGLGLWRARIQPAWAPVCFALSPVVYIIGSMVIGGDTVLIGAIAGVFAIIGSGAIGWRLLTSSDVVWERGAERQPATTQPVGA